MKDSHSWETKPSWRMRTQRQQVKPSGSAGGGLAGVDFRRIPELLRYMPDYYAQTGFFVEVMGLGRDGVLKGMKVDKWEAMKVWRQIALKLGLHDLIYYIWNADTKHFAVLSHQNFGKLITRSKREYGIQSFDDGNQYYPIPWKWILKAATTVGFYGGDGDG